MADGVLSGDFVSKTIGPLDALVGAAGNRRIMVYFGGSVMWSLPLDECQTWFVSTSPLLHSCPVTMWNMR